MKIKRNKIICAQTKTQRSICLCALDWSECGGEAGDLQMLWGRYPKENIQGETPRKTSINLSYGAGCSFSTETEASGAGSGQD